MQSNPSTHLIKTKVVSLCTENPILILEHSKATCPVPAWPLSFCGCSSATLAPGSLSSCPVGFHSVSHMLQSHAYHWVFMSVNLKALTSIAHLTNFYSFSESLLLCHFFRDLPWHQLYFLPLIQISFSYLSSQFSFIPLITICIYLWNFFLLDICFYR